MANAKVKLVASERRYTVPRSRVGPTATVHSAAPGPKQQYSKAVTGKHGSSKGHAASKAALTTDNVKQRGAAHTGSKVKK